MKILIFLMLTIIYLISFSGCAASGKKFAGFEQPKNGKSIVYFYRPDSFLGGGDTVFIGKDQQNSDGYEKNFLGNAVVTKLRNNSFSKKEFNPGIHTFLISLLVNMNINLEANTISCIRLTYGVLNLHTLESVNMDTCKFGINNTNLMTKEDEENIIY